MPVSPRSALAACTWPSSGFRGSRRSAASDQADGPFARVQASLEQQEPAVATQAAVAVLTTAGELLASFIGENLTTRLLHEAWPDEFAGDIPRRPPHDRQGSHPAPADGRPWTRCCPGRRRARILVQRHRRRAGIRQDHAGAADHVRVGASRSARPLLHRARRTAAQDAALPAAVRVLRRREGERVGAVHQPGEGGARRRARRGAEAHRPGSGGRVARASWSSTRFDRSSRRRSGRTEGSTCSTSSRSWACG